MKRRLSTFVLVALVAALCPCMALAQEATLQARADVSPSTEVSANDQAPAQGAQNTVTEAVKKWNLGVQGGISLDPELINFGVFGSFGPIFSPTVRFRPGVYLSFGEVTTEVGIDLDMLYTMPGSANDWHTYVGGGPNFAISHQGFSAETEVDTGNTTPPANGDGETTTTSRFDFGDTSFDAGFNFIVGATRGKAFFEMKATAWGVSNVRLLAGFRF